MASAGGRCSAFGYASSVRRCIRADSDAATKLPPQSHPDHGPTMTPLTIDSNRLWQSLMDLAQIGATPKGGVRRLTLTDLDRQGRDRFVGWCRDANMTI